jgi:hypothetical protein|tara:strand:- start:4010 stop:4246 length:237 start_codon:yes stop_codon:yes gene_type:complete
MTRRQSKYFLAVFQRLEEHLIKTLDDNFNKHLWYRQACRSEILRALHKIDDDEYNRLVFGEKLVKKLGFNPFKKGEEV